MLNTGVVVKTTQNRAATIEELADRCLGRIISVSDNAPEHVAAQAKAYKENLRSVIEFYMGEAVRADRSSTINKLSKAGQPEMAEFIRRL